MCILSVPGIAPNHLHLHASKAAEVIPLQIRIHLLRLDLRLILSGLIPYGIELYGWELSYFCDRLRAG